jgi:hypothetical protein
MDKQKAPKGINAPEAPDATPAHVPAGDEKEFQERAKSSRTNFENAPGADRPDPNYKEPPPGRETEGL